MHNVFAYFIFLVLVLTEQTSLDGTTPVPDDTTEVTWRDILPSSCGYRGRTLENKLKDLNGKTRPGGGLSGDKVANGQQTTIIYHPWQVALVTSDEKSFRCGGSIISKYHVLSASHCFLVFSYEVINKVKYDKVEPVPYTKRLVVVGASIYSESNLIYKIEQLYIHNYFSSSHHRNDIALLKIDGEFTWSTSVFPICLPDEDESYAPNRECIVSGFGNLGPDNANKHGIIHFGRVTLSNEQYCKKYNEKVLGNITEGMFCASGNLGDETFVDTCAGDSGGPLTCTMGSNGKQRVLLGITSFGHECGLMNYPGVFTKVAKYLQWIRDRVEVSLGYGYGHRRYLPEDVDVGRPAFISDV